MPRVFWVLAAATLAVCLAMNLWTAPRIEALAGGMRLFDMRLTGYGYDEAQAFVAALGAEGRAHYLGPQLWLDMVFPPLLAAVLFFTYRWLFPGWTGLAIGTAALSEVVADYMENARIAAMLRAGPEAMTPEMVAAASLWTTAKWSLAALGLVALLVGIALRVRRRRVAAAV